MGVVFPHQAGFEYKELFKSVRETSRVTWVKRKEERKKKEEKGKSSRVSPYLLTSRGGMYG